MTDVIFVDDFFHTPEIVQTMLSKTHLKHNEQFWSGELNQIQQRETFRGGGKRCVSWRYKLVDAFEGKGSDEDVSPEPPRLCFACCAPVRSTNLSEGKQCAIGIEGDTGGIWYGG